MCKITSFCRNNPAPILALSADVCTFLDVCPKLTQTNV